MRINSSYSNVQLPLFWRPIKEEWHVDYCHLNIQVTFLDALYCQELL
jgi:hypothetical protein